MRLLLIWPCSELSTYDVATGIRSGLLAEGHQVKDYRLYKRIECMSYALAQVVPDGQAPSIEDCCRQASEGLPYKVITSGCCWVFIISGMGLHPNAVWAARQIGARVACWFTEAPYESNDSAELHLASLCDIAFVNERTAVSTFQQALNAAGNGGRAVYLAHAYNPAVHHPGEPETEHVCDVLLVATGFRERVWLLEAIDWTGIDLRLGGHWPGILAPSRLCQYLRYPPMENQDLARLYASARIVINPHRWAPTAESANPRVWEVAACGAFQIADYRAEIADILGDAVPMYPAGVPWRLAALIRRYLADEPERRRLAELARRRVQAGTFAARARQVVEAIRDWEREHAGRRLAAVS